MHTTKHYSRFLIALTMLLFVGLSNNTGFAQQSSSSPSMDGEPEITSPEVNMVEQPLSVTVDSGLDESVTILRAQLQIMRDYHESLISTVYWTLGVVGAITLALLGFASYVNFRISGREVDAIRAEIFGHVDQKLAETSRDLDTATTEFRRDLSNKFDTSQERSEARIKNILDELKSDIQEEISKIDSTIEKSNNKITNKLKDYSYEMESMKLDILELESDHWNMSGVYQNEFRTRIRYVQLAASLPSPYDWKLDFGLRYLYAVFKNDFKQDPDLVSELITTLDKLSGDHRVIIDKIRDKLL